MNPKRSSGLMSGVSIGGAVASMNTSQGLSATSPPGGIARRRLMGGLGGARKGT